MFLKVFMIFTRPECTSVDFRPNFDRGKKLHNQNDTKRHHVRGADWPWNLHDPKNFSLTSASMRFKPSIFLSLLVILILFLDLLEAYRGHQKYPRGPKREGAFRRRRKLGFSRSVQVFYNNDNHQRRQPGQLRKQQIDVRCRHLARQRFDSCGPSILQGCRPWGCRGCHGTPRFWQIS